MTNGLTLNDHKIDAVVFKQLDYGIQATISDRVFSLLHCFTLFYMCFQALLPSILFRHVFKHVPQSRIRSVPAEGIMTRSLAYKHLGPRDFGCWSSRRGNPDTRTGCQMFFLVLPLLFWNCLFILICLLLLALLLSKVLQYYYLWRLLFAFIMHIGNIGWSWMLLLITDSDDSDSCYLFFYCFTPAEDHMQIRHGPDGKAVALPGQVG